MAQFAKNQGYKKPYLFSDLSILYTKEVCQYVETEWKALGGGGLAGKTTFQNSDTSFATQVAAVRKSGADSVILCSYPPGGPAVIRQLRASGVNLPVIASGGGMDGTQWLNAVPHLNNYYDVVMASLAGDDPVAKRNQLFQLVKKRTGAVPQLSAQALTGYAVTQVVKRAVLAAKGSTDGKTLEKVIEGFRKIDLLVGPVTYSTNCHIPVGMPMQVRQIKNGKPSWFKTVTIKKVPKSPC
jgi:branched-chain amino acid transport system substrate-binding protein